MDDTKAKYAPSDSMMRYWGVSTTIFLIVYFTMIVWGDLLSAYVDETLRTSIGTNLTLIFLVSILWNIRESIPLTVLMIKQIHHDIFIVPKEYEAEMQRIRDEWMRSVPPPPKPRRQPKMKPIGEPVNLRQWVGQRSTGNGGYIYILKDIEISGYYKIGKTRQPYDRMKAFGVRLPFETELIHVIECWNADRVEVQLHDKFADKRKQGEWFALTDDDIKWLKLYHKFDAA